MLPVLNSVRLSPSFKSRGLVFCEVKGVMSGFSRVLGVPVEVCEFQGRVVGLCG